MMEQGPCNVDAPPLAPGQLAHRPFQQIFKVQKPAQFRQPVLKIRAQNAVQGRPAFQIVPNGQGFIQHGVLEHHPQLPLDAVRLPVRVRLADGHAAGILGQLAAENVDGGGFSRTVDPQERKQFPFLHPEGQVPDSLHVPEGLAEMPDLDDIVHFSSSFFR